IVAFQSRSQREMYDFEVYRVAGGRVLAGESLYRVEDGHWQFKYLPAFAFVVAPLAALPPVAARAIWFGLSVALVVLLVNRSLVLLPDRRRSTVFLVVVLVLALGKYYVREVGLGQSNVLLAVLALLALAELRAGRDAAAGALFAAATIVKPYAILFLPYLAARGARPSAFALSSPKGGATPHAHDGRLVWKRRVRGVAGFGVVMAAALLLPAVRYGMAGNIALVRDWWETVTTSTAPNLAGQDNVSIAGMFAAWLGVGPLAGWLAAATALGLLTCCALAIARGRDRGDAMYLDIALLLFVIPLLSPQGWDYVLLISTPAVLLLLDRLDRFGWPVQAVLLACLALGGLTIWDVMGREPYRVFMMSRVVTIGALVQIALVIRLRARQLA
ncbi:MAG: glycosyltransferase 87 family protein, partial [Acidobacteria bacterium]|nr:glycosyltransferase 87 family protein [Acidobacteriota bacterium]